MVWLSQLPLWPRAQLDRQGPVFILSPSALASATKASRLIEASTGLSTSSEGVHGRCLHLERG